MEKSIYKTDEFDLSTTGNAKGAIMLERYYLPTLKFFFINSKSEFKTNEELYDFIEKNMSLSDQDRIDQSGQEVWKYRLAWTMTTLRNAELLEKDTKAYKRWKVSEQGIEFVIKHKLDEKDDLIDSIQDSARKEINKRSEERKKGSVEEFKDKSIIDLEGKRIFKLSMGIFKRNLDVLNLIEENGIGVMHRDTKRSQGRNFVDKAEIGDFVYITFGQRRLGNLYKISSDVKNLDGLLDDMIDGEGWVYRELDLVKESLNNHSRELSHLKSGWLPSGFTTFYEVSDSEMRRANELFFKPYFGVSFNNGIEEKIQKKEIEEDYEGIEGMRLNTILYGPPGTGKTHSFKEFYLDSFVSDKNTITKEEFLDDFISDLTWWETLALSLLDKKELSVGDLLNHPFVVSKLKFSNSKIPRATLWGQLQSHTVEECTNVKVKKKQSPLLFNKTNSKKWEIVEAELKELCPELITKLDEINKYNPELEKINRYEFVTFHQSYSYEDFVEGIKPVMDDSEGGEINYEIKPGVFKLLCDRAQKDRNNHYAIFIDEINRGNVSSVFGELITLIEKDKRLGAKNELKVRLPYSRDWFGVPNNLYIIGTMNTADRSVEALDTALRRRFSFEEKMPDSKSIERHREDRGILEDNNTSVNLLNLLNVINERLEGLIDRDHTIGHSYFMNISSLEELEDVFENNIIPLLQEFFYNDYSKIGLVLGKGFIKNKPQKVSFAPFSQDGIFNEGSKFQLISFSDESFNIVDALEKLESKKESIVNKKLSTTETEKQESVEA